jgi:hypothetical protein
MKKTRIAIVAALVLVLAVVGVAAAQSDTPENPSDTGESSGAFPWKDNADGQGRRGGRINGLAEAFGMTVEELKAELSSGKTIIELAEEKGIDLQQMAIDKATEKLQQAVDNGRLTQEEADQKLAEIQEKIESGEGFERPDRGDRLEGFAETLGMTVEELQTALDAGQTPQEIAEAQGIDLQQLAVDRITEKLQQAVENGRLTQEEADQKLAEIQEKIESGEGTFFKSGDRSHGGFGGFRGDTPAE